jgi:phosphoesterase RecJ-like protein
MLNAQQTAEWFRERDGFLLLTHVRPDGDTIGSAAGLCAGLRALGKTAYLLPNPELTESTEPYAVPCHAPEDFLPETVVTVDIAALSLLPENAKAYADRIDFAIDHHPSHEDFSPAFVRPEAAATGEMIYDILCHLGPITPEMALPLYVAVSTDSGCFAYGNTTAYTHAVAAALIRTGIDIQPVNKTFFRTKSRNWKRIC